MAFFFLMSGKNGFSFFLGIDSLKGTIYNIDMDKIFDFKFFHRHNHKGNSVERLHNHPFYEVVYYVTGNGKGSIAQSEYSYKAGTVIFIPPGKKHSEIHETDTEVMFFAFDAQETHVRAKQSVYMDNEETIYQLFLGIEKEIKNMRPLFRDAINLKIEQMLLEFGRTEIATKERNLIEECMEYAVNYMQAHIQQNIDFQELARVVGYSYDYFRHQFVNHFGVSPKEYILQERIQHIKKRLTN